MVIKIYARPININVIQKIGPKKDKTNITYYNYGKKKHYKGEYRVLKKKQVIQRDKYVAII